MVDVFTHRLLVLQTDPDAAAALTTTAVELGFDVDRAADAAGVDRLTRDGHDTVWLDIGLGPVDGLKALRLLRERQPGVAVVLEGDPDPGVLLAARRVAERSGLRVIDTVARPVDPDRRRRLLEASRATIQRDDTGAIRRLGDVATTAARVGTVRLLYQPRVDLETDEIDGAEALVRLDVPGFESVSPDTWIPHVERTGASRHLLEAVARQAAEDRRRHPALGTLGSVSINVSTGDLVDLTLPDRLAGLLTETMPATRWTLEITETLETPTDERLIDALDVLTRLRLLGFGVAMDDFGTGASTFERLREFPFTELKVNRHFTALDATRRHGSPTESMPAMLQAAAGIGRALGLTVVVEGVETPAEWSLARASGCHAMQGYLVSGPVTPDRFGPVRLDWANRRRDLGGDRSSG